MQIAYNAEHGIDPQTIRKAVGDILSMLRPDSQAPVPGKDSRRQRERDKVQQELKTLPAQEMGRLIQTLEAEMHEAAAELKFEYAARLRDEVHELRRELRDATLTIDRPQCSPVTERDRRQRCASVAGAAALRSRLMIELHSIEHFDEHLAAFGSLNGVVVQGVDLVGAIRGVASPSRATVRCSSGVASVGPVLERMLDGGAVVFPRLAIGPVRHLPVAGCTRRASCCAGGSAGDPVRSPPTRSIPRSTGGRRVRERGAEGARDQRAGAALARPRDRRRARRTPRRPRRRGRGDGRPRGAAAPTRIYRTVAELGRAMTREGWHVATGGGPGAMEAANLGAWLAPHPDAALDDALELLAAEVDYRAADEYLGAGQAVLDAFGSGGESLAVPTWFYGHEPTNQFATAVAKYFANSIREDGLLAIATRGVVFAPGAAGTTQEVFQDATQNHYDVFGVISPMVFLDTTFWTETLPAEPLLRTPGRRSSRTPR